MPKTSNNKRSKASPIPPSTKYPLFLKNKMNLLHEELYYLIYFFFAHQKNTLLFSSNTLTNKKCSKNIHLFY